MHVVRQFYPMIGGMENFVYLLSTQQIRQGDEVTVLTLDRNFMNNEKLPAEDEHHQIKIIRISYLGINRYPVAFSATRFIKDFNILHIHGVDFFVDYLAMMKPFHQKKIVLHTHGGFFHTRWGFWFKKIFFNTITRFTVNRIDKVIAISNNDFFPFRKLTKNVVQIENGIDFDIYQQPKKLIRDTLITVGRIDTHKRIDLLIKITLKLHEMGYPATLRIIGPDWKGLKDGLAKLIPKDKKDFITFVGPVDDRQLVDEYASAHLFLSASEYEGFGLTAVEAMASGTPVVLNDIDSFRIFLENREFGGIAKFRNIEETANVIGRFLDLPEDEYHRLSKHARKYAENYSWPKIESKIRDVYKEVLSG